MSLRSLFWAGVMAMRVDAAQYEYTITGGNICWPAPSMLLSETQCEDYCSTDSTASALTYVTVSDSGLPPACFRSTRCYYNAHPTGLQMGDQSAAWNTICLAEAPTPAPTPATPAPTSPTAAPTASPTTGHQTVSGDPIFKINGFTAKFDLPLNVDTLLLSGHGIEVFGRADVTTPDYKNQWFSTISILKDKFMSARIERRALRATHPEHQALNSLSFVLTNHDGRTMMISNPGEYEGGEFTLRHAGSLGRDIPREVVTVKLRGFEFAVGAQIAKKFKEKELQLNYAHLDLDLRDMRPATKGLFAELFGIIPMSKNTAQLIKSVHK